VGVGVDDEADAGACERDAEHVVVEVESLRCGVQLQRDAVGFAGVEDGIDVEVEARSAAEDAPRGVA
jgi:hypothetical protein